MAMNEIHRNNQLRVYMFCRFHRIWRDTHNLPVDPIDVSRHEPPRRLTGKSLKLDDPGGGYNGTKTVRKGVDINSSSGLEHAVDGRNPAPPGTYKTL